jgi:hypothetical protein
MPDARDILFGQIAIEKDLVTQEQLDAALKQQSGGDARQLGMILIESGHLDEHELDIVLEVQRERLARTARTADNSTSKLSDVLFGRLVVARKLATQSQVNECIREQASLEAMGMFMRVGEILVKKGYLTEAQIEEVAAYQKQQLESFGTE